LVVFHQRSSTAFSSRRLWNLKNKTHNLRFQSSPRQIIKLARKGQTPSQIGVVLRDQSGIPQVGTITGSKILRILKGKG
jgi:hypothetical protein